MLLARDIRGLGREVVKANHESQRRRHAQARRLRIDREDYHGDKVAHLGGVYKNPKVISALSKFVDDAPNLLQRVADRLAVAYKIPPQRSIGRTGGKDYVDAVRTSRLDTVLRQVSRLAFVAGKVWVTPVQRGDSKVLGYEVITPDRVVQVWHGDDPHNPDVLAYRIGAEDPKAPGASMGPTYVVQDAEGWLTLDGHGDPLTRRPNPTGEVMHTLWRVTEPHPDDWWDWRRNEKLVASTLEAARVWAAMGYVRSQQNRKLLTIVAEDRDKIPDGQVTEPHDAVVLEAEAGTAELKAVDFDTGIDKFRDELRMHAEAAVEPFGIPVSLVDPSASADDLSNTSDLAASKQYQALAEVRDGHLEFLRQSERDLAVAVSRLIGSNPEQVRRNFQITFPPLTYADHPLKRQEIYVGAIKLGLMDHADAYQLENPGTTRDEAKAAVLEKIEQRNEFNRLLADRNIPADPMHEGEPVTARQGRIGGQASPPETDVQP